MYESIHASTTRYEDIKIRRTSNMIFNGGSSGCAIKEKDVARLDKTKIRLYVLRQRANKKCNHCGDGSHHGRNRIKQKVLVGC